MSDEFLSLAAYAKHAGMSEKTIRNYGGAGYFEMYDDAPNRPRWWIKVAEADAALARLPRARARGGKKPFGPKARVRRMPVRPQVVNDGLGK